MAAITKGSQLYVDIKLVGARNVTKSSIVNSLNGLTLWLEATSSDSFDKENLAEGDKVNIWRNIGFVIPIMSFDRISVLILFYFTPFLE